MGHDHRHPAPQRRQRRLPQQRVDLVGEAEDAEPHPGPPAQVALLRDRLAERAQHLPLVVDFAMRYGAPSIAEKLREMKAQNCNRILLMPLYPQYSASTTATVHDAAFRCLQEMRNQPALRTVRSFHDHPGYIAALARSARDYWARNRRPDVLLMSFHGVPRATLYRWEKQPEFESRRPRRLRTPRWPAELVEAVEQLRESEDARQEYLGEFSSRGLTLTALNCNGNPLFPREGFPHAQDLIDSIELAALLGVTRLVTMSGIPAGSPGGTNPVWNPLPWWSPLLDVRDYQWEVAIPFWKDIQARAADAVAAPMGSRCRRPVRSTAPVVVTRGSISAASAASLQSAFRFRRLAP